MVVIEDDSPVLARDAQAVERRPHIREVDAEVLLGDSTRFARRARAAGVPVQLEVQDGGWHNYPIWYGVPEADAAVASITAFLAGVALAVGAGKFGAKSRKVGGLES